MKKAGIGWLGLVAYVVAYDYWAIKTHNETLSSAFYRAANHKAVRYPHGVVSLVIIKHLVFPKVLTKYDPLYYIAERWRGAGQLSGAN